MNILTFDIEDWYNCDFITFDFNWDKYEVRIYEGVQQILQELTARKLKATFFCLGWIAEKHPEVIKLIHAQGHHIGCHSYQHQLAFRFDRAGFRWDTEKSKKLIEDLIGESINAFRAPGFSITEQNVWALEVLTELGFEYDCSILSASHDYGGFLSFGKAEPAILNLANGAQLKEFPMTVKRLLGRNLVFSGGGYFRFYPYWLIKYWALKSPYLMTYFHTRDFDPGQPMINSLPMMRKIKSYVGLSTSFAKVKKLLNDFEFVSVRDADKLIDWETTRMIEF
ncbi:MAG: polysaccharide deacetylase family protein [Desulfobacterales bacterium]|nr:polysaccharide deacetylase family protein [Desulfobacterales bacterium]